jgi:hypothetical protein
MNTSALVKGVHDAPILTPTPRGPAVAPGPSATVAPAPNHAQGAGAGAGVDAGAATPTGPAVVVSGSGGGSEVGSEAASVPAASTPVPVPSDTLAAMGKAGPGSSIAPGAGAPESKAEPVSPLEALFRGDPVLPIPAPFDIHTLDLPAVPSGALWTTGGATTPSGPGPMAGKRGAIVASTQLGAVGITAALPLPMQTVRVPPHHPLSLPDSRGLVSSYHPYPAPSQPFRPCAGAVGSGGGGAPWRAPWGPTVTLRSGCCWQWLHGGHVNGG